MSAKASSQPGRRTPMSLTAATSKQQQQNQQLQKISSTSNDIKIDNKSVALNQPTEKLPDSKESLQKDKKQQSQGGEKKMLQTSKIPTASLTVQIKKTEKNDEKKTQNGVSHSNSNAKDKQSNGKDPKINIKENKEKPDTLENDKSKMITDDSEKIDKSNENADKKVTKTEDVEKQTDSDKSKVIEKDTTKDNKKQPEKEGRAKRGFFENDVKKNQEKQQELAMQSFAENETPLSNTELKQETPVKHFEKSPHSKSTPTRGTKSSPAVTPSAKSTNTIIDDVEMEPLNAEKATPIKDSQPAKEFVAVPLQIAANKPTATSTPGKSSKGKEILTTVHPSAEVKSTPLIQATLPNRNSCPRTFSQISGRRSIRAGSDYTSFFQSNTQYRESYRKINTELDVTSTTNTSLNVTVGSEVPNNSSFSFFGRGRKRDRTPPNSRSAMDLQSDLELSPKSPKRARVDMYGFFSAVASPLSLLRARFSKASIQSSTPVKQRLILAENGEDDVEVQNVSGISTEEEISKNAGATEDVTTTEELTVENVDENKKISSSPTVVSFDVDDAEVKKVAVPEKCIEEKPAEEGIDDDFNDIKVTETVTVAEAMSKNKRCNVM